MKKLYVSSLLICVLSLLAACGSSDPEPETPSDETVVGFKEQEVAWEPCDPNIFGGAGIYEVLAPVQERLECATLRAPLDWGNPELDEINLGVLRVRAGNPDARKGAILLNPGGPGGDGLIEGALFGLIFASGTEGLPVAAPDLLAQVSEQYDIVGFSPRGVGGSVQLFCGSNKVAPVSNFYTDRSQENVQALLTGARLQADACLNNPLSKYITTDQTVQDMDLIRSVLGDEKLNFLGYSYGSWLGAWYAKKFPQQAGNIVLDANVDFSAPYQDSEAFDPMSFERAFREVALEYGARNSASFALGSSAQEVYSVYEGLPQALKRVLIDGRTDLMGSLFSSDAVPFINTALVAAKGLNAVLQAFEGDDVNALLEDVAAYTYAPDPSVDESARELALTQAEDRFELEAIQAGEIDLGSVALPPFEAVNTAVRCNESAWNQDPNFWIEEGDRANETYPLIGGNATSQSCAFWDEAGATMPELPEEIAPILIVQSELDAATAAEGALQAFESLPNGKLVFVEYEMNHTSFPYNTECVDTKVAAYLLNGTLPEEDVSSCAAKPLPGETQVFPVDGPTPNAQSALSSQAVPEERRENSLYDLFHEMIAENAADFMTQQPMLGGSEQ